MVSPFGIRSCVAGLGRTISVTASACAVAFTTISMRLDAARVGHRIAGVRHGLAGVAMAPALGPGGGAARCGSSPLGCRRLSGNTSHRGNTSRRRTESHRGTQATDEQKPQGKHRRNTERAKKRTLLRAGLIRPTALDDPSPVAPGLQRQPRHVCPPSLCVSAVFLLCLFCVSSVAWSALRRFY